MGSEKPSTRVCAFDRHPMNFKSKRAVFTCTRYSRRERSPKSQMIFSLSYYKTTRNFFLSIQHPVLALYNSRKIHQPPQVQKLISKAQISRVLLINHVKDHVAWPSSVAFEGQLIQSTQVGYPEICISLSPRLISSTTHLWWGLPTLLTHTEIREGERLF